MTTCPLTFRTLVAAALLAAGPLVSASPSAQTSAETAFCLDLFRAVDQTVADAKKRDAEAHRLREFPYLRSNRYLASYRHEVDGAEEIGTWLRALGELDRQARVIELQNLYPRDRARHPVDVEQTLDTCRSALIAGVLEEPQTLARLRRQSAVPDAYSPAARTLGLYPLTAPGVALGYRNWLNKALPAFALDPLRPADTGTLRLWGPPEPPGDAVEFGALPRDALGQPILDDATFATLVRQHAPVFAIETVDGFDVPGRPRPGLASVPPTVRSDDPVVYVRASWQRSEQGPLLQLTYTLWFAGRPLSSPLDLLGGALDAVMWRVTLTPDGQPWVYDTAHACGCYHFAFPVPPAVALAQAAERDLREPLIVPMPAPQLAHGERLAIRLQAGTHYVEGLAPIAADAATDRYRLTGQLNLPDAGLRSTEGPLGRQSLYGEDGLIAGSERGERWFLWPMGIDEPGAMRQWGHHATAFVGRRHFDDPWLLDDVFTNP